MSLILMTLTNTSAVDESGGAPESYATTVKFRVLFSSKSIRLVVRTAPSKNNDDT